MRELTCKGARVNGLLMFYGSDCNSHNGRLISHSRTTPARLKPYHNHSHIHTYTHLTTHTATHLPHYLAPNHSHTTLHSHPTTLLPHHTLTLPHSHPITLLTQSTLTLHHSLTTRVTPNPTTLSLSPHTHTHLTPPEPRLYKHPLT